ncbi:MAG: prolyl oligopeptidase family serine peptidase [Gemmatimonadota bacterium]
MRLFLTGILLAAACLSGRAQQTDPLLWLEDIHGERALAWVRERNAQAEKEFAADPRYEPLRKELLAILDSPQRIPYATRMGEFFYNFWRDADHPRGIWRRTTIDDYRSSSPRWDTVLDLDELASHEGENWVWHGAECLRPEQPTEPYRHCILALSRGGADAVVLREFDLIDRRLVLGPNAFVLGEDKQSINWKDADTVWVMSAFRADEKTTSGYPRVAREWKRGSLASTAPIVFEGRHTDVGVDVSSERESGRRRDWYEREIAFWDSEYLVADGDRKVKLDIPADAQPISFHDWLLIRTRTPWTTGGSTYPGGSLLAIRFDLFLRGSRTFFILYEPHPRASLVDVALTKSAVLITELDNVRSRLWELTFDGQNWNRGRVPTPEFAQVDIAGSYWASDDYQYTVQDFLTPTTLWERNASKAVRRELKSLPAFFKADGLQTQQFEATSRDGTRIPYFVVMRKDAKLDGNHPTLLTGYGGFAEPELPFYSGAFGKGWLEPGGVFVLANLRGGGEFGPEWHRAAQKEHKQRTWDDFIAVAEDLVKRGITSPKKLGIVGGSQGGLLVTATMVQRPDLFGAVVAQVPLTDMLRYHKLLAGASWIAEYGDPDRPDERAYIEKYSPYQNVKKDAKYPRIFLTTSTRDDRVDPGHARKLAAKMIDQGHDVLYFENVDGGHSDGADNAQRARMWAQTFSFLWRQLAPR